VNAKMTFAGLINALFRPAHPTPPKLGTPPFVGMINDRFGSLSDLGARSGEVRITLKNRRRLPGLSGPKSASSGSDAHLPLILHELPAISLSRLMFLEVFPILLVGHIRVLPNFLGEVKEDRFVRVVGNHTHHRGAIAIHIDATLAADGCTIYFTGLFTP